MIRRDSSVGGEATLLRATKNRNLWKAMMGHDKKGDGTYRYMQLRKKCLFSIAIIQLLSDGRNFPHITFYDCAVQRNLQATKVNWYSGYWISLTNRLHTLYSCTYYAIFTIFYRTFSMKLGRTFLSCRGLSLSFVGRHEF